MAEQQTTMGRLAEVARVFLKLGALSYGGPAIMGIMQAEIQEKRQWITKEKFLEGMALVNMLPGPIATQLGIYLGYDRAGWRGGIVAGLSFMLPAFVILMLLTLAYSAYGTVQLARNAFYGLGPVVLGIFFVAVYRLGKAGVRTRTHVAIAIASAALLTFAPIGIAGVLLLAGCIGVAVFHSRKWGLIGLGVMAVLIGTTHVLLAVSPSMLITHASKPGLPELALYFVKVGAFTFGGGITVLAFMQDQVVNQFHWLTAQEFLDGLALGQLTPGPVLMLAAYVGYKAGGVWGGVVGALAVFLPAFVVMLSILPALARFKRVAWLKSAMSGATAAVLGVLAVSLLRLVPHAAPDAITSALLVLTIAAIMMWRLAPLSLIAGGALAGIAVRMKSLQRLKDLA